MSDAAPYLLYGTLGCHLCDEAQAVLMQLGLAAQACDIADNDTLLARYGERIPVLRERATGRELNWPFDVRALAAWLDSAGS